MQKRQPHKMLGVLVLIAALLVLPLQATAASARNAEEAIAAALEQNGGKGKVLGVRDKVSDGGDAYFQVKVLLNGKVRIFRIKKL